MHKLMNYSAALVAQGKRLRSFTEGMRSIILPPAPASHSLHEPNLETWIRLGAFACFGLFGGFLLWASLAPIASAALGNGTVKVETSRKIVQNLEGGLLREILIGEGQKVHKGQTLFRLDSVDADADRDLLQGQYDLLIAREWRLKALRAGLDQPDATQFDVAQRRPRLQEALVSQLQIFEEQRNSLAKQVDVWKKRRDQFSVQAHATQIQVSALKAQKPLLEEELKDARNLFGKGYGLKPRVLGLERQVESMRGEIATITGKLASLQEQAREVDAQILSLTSTEAKRVSEELQDVQTKKSEAEDSLKKIMARHGRREVVSPVDGIAMNIRTLTVGGIIAPGGPLVDIVPSGEKLILEAKLQPTDIDAIRPDLETSVRFVAYKQRSTPVVKGKVVRISADAVNDERGGASFYVATVEVHPDELARVPHVRLYPGMPVEIAIITGQRTMLAYLMQPFTDSLARSFRED